jgi:hypothetical protein
MKSAISDENTEFLSVLEPGTISAIPLPQWEQHVGATIELISSIK